MGLRLGLVIGFLLATTACFDPVPQPGAPCGEGNACPSGFVCVANLCVPPGGPDPSECEGQPDGTACGDSSASACDAGDTCQAGQCVPNHVTDGATCGDASASECDAGDTCQAGACVPNNVADGTSCGSAPAGDCDAQDSCMAGQCIANDAADGTACGAAPSGMCDLQDTCMAGQCMPQIVNDGTACNGTPTGMCDAQDTCSSGQCISNLMPDGTNCNGTPSGACDAQDKCMSGTCVANNLPNGTLCNGAPVDACDAQGACMDGTCANDYAPPGTLCGSAGTSLCDLQDTCNGTGTCMPNYANAGTACGSSTVTACDLADSCNASGTCMPNYRPAGTACGSQTVTDCDNANSCNASGTCLANNRADGLVCYDCGSGLGNCTTCTTGSCSTATCTPSGGGTGTPASLTNPPLNNSLSFEGNMFDLVAATPITITSIDQHFSSANAATTFDIYYKTGTHVGFETTPTAWTLLGTANMTTGALQTLTPVPIALSINVAAGQRIALYVTNRPSVRNSYAMGTAVGNVAVSNADLTLYEGTSQQYSFMTPSSPRSWQGRINYTTGSGGASTNLATTAAGASTSDGIMWDMTATNQLRVTRLAVQLNAGDQDVDIYFRRGTHVGNAAAATGWEMLASLTNVASAGPGQYTDLPVSLSVIMAAGSTSAFYITKGGGQDELRSSVGTTVGATASSDTNLTIKQGIEIANTFEPVAGAKIPNVRVTYSVCGP